MAITAATLDKARYTMVYKQGRDGGLIRLPFAFVDIDGEQFVETLPDEVSEALVTTQIPKTIVGQQVMPHLPWPLANEQPARDTNTAAGEVAVHFFGGV